VISGQFQSTTTTAELWKKAKKSLLQEGFEHLTRDNRLRFTLTRGILEEERNTIKMIKAEIKDLQRKHRSGTGSKSPAKSFT
jgi:hypothetical protein